MTCILNEFCLSDEFAQTNYLSVVTFWVPLQFQINYRRGSKWSLQLWIMAFFDSIPSLCSCFELVLTMIEYCIQLHRTFNYRSCPFPQHSIASFLPCTSINYDRIVQITAMNLHYRSKQIEMSLQRNCLKWMLPNYFTRPKKIHIVDAQR